MLLVTDGALCKKTGSLALKHRKVGDSVLSIFSGLKECESATGAVLYKEVSASLCASVELRSRYEILSILCYSFSQNWPQQTCMSEAPHAKTKCENLP